MGDIIAKLYKILFSIVFFWNPEDLFNMAPLLISCAFSLSYLNWAKKYEPPP